MGTKEILPLSPKDLRREMGIEPPDCRDCRYCARWAFHPKIDRCAKSKGFASMERAFGRCGLDGLLFERRSPVPRYHWATCLILAITIFTILFHVSMIWLNANIISILVLIILCPFMFPFSHYTMNACSWLWRKIWTK